MSPVGLPHAFLAIRLGSWLDSFVSGKRLGRVASELGCVLFRNPDVVRAPDVCFISAARLMTAAQQGFFEGAPDLVVEILSPDDRASDVLEKVRQYLEAGARLVLVADPQTQTVSVHHPSGDAHVYSGTDEVSGGDAFPGFSFRPSDLFRLE